MGGLIKKMWSVYTVGFYLVVKKNEIMSLSGKWVELEINLLGKNASLNEFMKKKGT
jgi:hypothetical protein